jgi:predicted MFS family arabinose efflux permease
MAEGSTGDAAPPIPRRGGEDPRLSAGEWLLLLVLAAVQFAHIVDFMIIMPLGSRFINAEGGPGEAASLHLTPRQFGLVVSAYTLSAGAASLLASRFLDRFDRKTALLALFAGFTLGTLLCAAATSFPLLLAARAVAGAFCGVSAANLLAIVGDAFPDSRRGTATGVVMSAFSVASIAGVPLGLYLADLLDWRAPFAVLGALSGAVLVLAAWVLPPLRGHLGRRRSPVSPWAVATDPNHVRAYALMVSLVGSSFLVIPYLATYMVANVGLPEGDLKFIYVCGGVTTLLTLTVIGRLADRLGKLPVFRVLALATTVPLFLITVLPPGLSLALVLAVTTLMFVTTSGRMVPGMALITNSSAPRVRGSFMSLNTAVQQMGAGLASWVGGLLLQKGEGGRLTGYPLVGLLACAAAAASVYLAGRLRPAPGGASAPDTAAAQGASGPGPEVPPAAEAAAIAAHFNGYRAAPGAVGERGGVSAAPD